MAEPHEVKDLPGIYRQGSMDLGCHSLASTPRQYVLCSDVKHFYLCFKSVSNKLNTETHFIMTNRKYFHIVFFI